MNFSILSSFRALPLAVLFTFLLPFSSFGSPCCGGGEGLSLTELLNASDDERSIFRCRVDSCFCLPSQGFVSYVTLLETFRGKIVADKLVIKSGGTTSSGGHALQVKGEYLVFGQPEDSITFKAFVCDFLSHQVYSPTRTIDANTTALPIVRQYFNLQQAGYTGQATFKIGDKTMAEGGFANGRPHGHWMHYRTTDGPMDRRLKSDLNYWEGQYTDTCRYYDYGGLSQLSGLSVFDKGIKLYEEGYSKSSNGHSRYISRKVNYQSNIDGSFYRQSKTYKEDGRLSSVSSSVELNIGSLSDGVYFKTYLEGHQKNYHRNGKLKEEGDCHLGAKIGTWRSYSETGDLLKAEYFNMPDTTIAPFVLFHSDGGVRVIGQWANGKPEGRWVGYHEGTGRTLFTLNFKNGLLHGNLKVYNNDKGQLSREEYYINGKKNGVEKHYHHLQSTVSLTTTYMDGKTNGEHKEYFPDGQLSAVYYLKNGLHVGDFVRYYVPGLISEKGQYLNGNKHGLFEELERDKQVAKGEYYYGRKVGTWKTYYPSGQLSAECRFPAIAETDLRRIPNFGPLSCIYYHEDGTVKTDGK